MSTFKGKFEQVKEYLSLKAEQEDTFKKYLQDKYGPDTLPLSKIQDFILCRNLKPASDSKLSL